MVTRSLVWWLGRMNAHGVNKAQLVKLEPHPLQDFLSSCLSFWGDHLQPGCLTGLIARHDASCHADLLSLVCSDKPQVNKRPYLCIIRLDQANRCPLNSKCISCLQAMGAGVAQA